MKTERLRQSGDQPFAVETCYLPADEFAGLLKRPLERRSLFRTLQRDYGVDLQYADEEVDATPASARVAELLAVHAGSPVLRIRQALFSAAGKATVYVIGFYRSDRHTLSIRRFRREGALQAVVLWRAWISCKLHTRMGSRRRAACM